MALEAMIFAIDGVLAETHEARRETFNDVFSEAEVSWHWDRARFAKLLKATNGEDMISAFVSDELARWRHPDDLATMISAMNRRHVRLFHGRLRGRRVQLREGFVPFLQAAARKGIRLAIATREGEDTARLLIEARLPPRLASQIEVVAGADEAGNVYAEAVERLAISSQSCLAIESSARGLNEARAAGVPTLLTWGIYAQLDLCAAALSGAHDAPFAGVSSAMLSRWDCVSPSDLVDHVREIQAAQCRFARAIGNGAPAPSMFQTKEVSHAGLGYLEA
jgi:beta-phosphoglucomutase-like phosphatase (HAD superfamily)